MPELPTTVEELTINREGDERMAPRRELRKKVLTSGAWSTVLYSYIELKRSKKGEEWSGAKVSLVRYRKLKGAYKFQKEFAISNLDHVRMLHEAMGEWLGEDLDKAATEAAAEADAAAAPAEPEAEAKTEEAEAKEGE